MVNYEISGKTIRYHGKLLDMENYEISWKTMKYQGKTIKYNGKL